MDLLQVAEQYVTKMYTDMKPSYQYHNLDHTLMVFDAATQIGRMSNLSAEDLLILQISALFHDTGFVSGPENHEAHSQKIATEFLNKQNCMPQFIAQVNSNINATKMGQEASDLQAQILQDADMSGLAKDNYGTIVNSLRKEKNMISGNKISKTKWAETNIEFLTNCQYNTPAAITLFREKKNHNLEMLKAKIAKKKNKKSATPQNIVPAKAKLISGNKSAQTQFKTALRNHIDLSNIADNKANIMLSVNALILTVALPFLIDRAIDNPNFFIPAAILAIVCLGSMIYATLSTRPIHLKGYTSLEEIKNRTSNLFFFGNYHQMSYVEYKTGVQHILEDEEALDDSIMRDLFFLGKSLGKKFSYLRYCYTIFMYGIILTVLTIMLLYFF